MPAEDVVVDSRWSMFGGKLAGLASSYTEGRRIGKCLGQSGGSRDQESSMHEKEGVDLEEGTTDRQRR